MMTLAESLLEELKHEALGTGRILERVPTDKLGWQPHEKSMTLGRLAAHVAEIPGWLHETIKQDELDFEKADFAPTPLDDTAALMNAFEESLNKGINALKDATDENILGLWRLRNGPQILMQMPRIGVIRGMVLNHLVHHRGQLSVYLRMLDVPVPGMYGPSADDVMG
jgi:uncharacterized damage-inducible protein DinB